MNRAAIAALAFAVGVTGFVGLAQAQESEARKAARATLEITLARLMQDRDRAVARQGMLEALRQDSSWPEPRYHLGILAEADENWGDAIQWFEEFRRLDPSSRLSVQAQLELDKLRTIQALDATPEGRKRRQYEEKISQAKRLVRSGFLKEAVVVTSEAAGLDDSRWEAYAIAGSALAQDNILEDALAFLNRAFDRAPVDKRNAIHAALDRVRQQKQAAALGVEGAQALQSKDYGTAALFFSRAWDASPRQGDYGLSAALAYALAGQYDKALQTWTRVASKAEPQVAKKARDFLAALASRNAIQPDQWYASLGDHLRDERRYSDAESVYRQAVQLAPNVAQWHTNLGVALDRQDRWREAEQEYREAVRLAPGVAHWHRNLAIALVTQGKWAEAEPVLRKQITLQPRLADPHGELSWALVQQKRWSDAETEAREAIRLAPKVARWQGNLGASLRGRGKWSDAEAAYEEAIRLEPQHYGWHAYLGMVLGRAQKWPNAEAALRRSIALEPRWAEAYGELAFVLLNQQRWTDAEVEAREAVRREPGKAQWHGNLGWAVRGQAKWGDAEVAYREAARLEPTFHGWYGNLGLALLSQQKWTEAEAALGEALRLEPRNLRYQEYLKSVLQAKGQ